MSRTTAVTNKRHMNDKHSYTLKATEWGVLALETESITTMKGDGIKWIGVASET